MPEKGAPQVPLEKEQGAVQAEEMLEAGAPGPAAQDVTMQAAEMAAEAVAPEGTEQPAEQVAPAQGYTVKNPYMLMPQAANYGQVGGQRPKTQSETNYDGAVLFQVLATDPVFKTISAELLGTRKRGV